MEKISILITDDHTLLRETWALILKQDPRISTVTETASGEEAVRLAQQLLPDIVIMDINLPGINGIEATQLIRKHNPHTRIIGVSMHSEPSYAVKMMQEGASGYLTKNASSQEMFQAIMEVHKGRKYLGSEIKDRLAEQLLHRQSVPASKLLSARELEIVTLVKKGLTSKEIAAELMIAPKTVEVHRSHALKKLELKNTPALINFMNTNPELFI